ncbi:MAG: PIG-L family deacetylase [Candidatus Hydrogenedens sp.]|nr:PIG-L family deacetylase [Candidatus Hydrogenedens sp.]
MNLSRPEAELYIPDGTDEEAALARTTHLAIGAHQDDLEIMAAHGILACYEAEDQWFTGVTVTHGGGTPRSGAYADYSDEQMIEARNEEQREAARLGRYTAQFLLAHPSAAVKERKHSPAVADIEQILRATTPRFLYTHNLADKHDTHIGVALRVIEAVRRLPLAERPKSVYGCEVWRDLDWLVDDEKYIFDLSEHEELQDALVAVFQSQIAGGKRYDLAAMGRRRAHATYSASHVVDNASGASFAMDLTPLAEDDRLDPAAYVCGCIDRLRMDVRDRIERFR